MSAAWRVKTRTSAVSQSLDEFDTAREFWALADEWERDTSHLSAIPKIVMHQAHQKIIGMGPRALPLILRRMRDRPGYWFWALETIARESPIKAEDAGYTRRMKQAWLDWGTSKGLI